MKNKEKYQKEIIDVAIESNIVSLVNGVPKSCGSTRCKDCQKFLMKNGKYICSISRFKEWAEAEYEEPQVDWSKVPVDTKILVSDDFEYWYKRYFAKYENGKIYAFSCGSTAWSSEGCYDKWKYAKLAEE